MVKDKQKAIFSENLNSYIAKSEKTQLEIAKSIGVSPQTFNTWCKGIAIPRMGKVQALADYFNINKSDLIEDKKLNIDTVPIESGYTIPVLGRVAAGYGKEAVEEVSPGLAAPFGAVDLHTAKRPHKGVEALLYEPGPISLLGQSLWCIHRRPSLSITRYAKLRHSQC